MVECGRKELCAEGSDQPVMLGGGVFDRVAIGGGSCVVLSGYSGAG